MTGLDSRSLSAKAAVLSALVMTTAACGTAGLATKAQPIDVSQAPLMALPDGVELSAAQWPLNHWWQAFGDTQLDAVLERALSGSPNLRLAQARVDEALAKSGLAAASLEPTVNGSGAVTRQRFAEHGTTPPPVAGTWNYVAQATLGVQYELDFWGRNREAVAGAVGRQHASEVEAAAARLMLTTAVVQSYIALQNTDDQIEIEQRQLDRQQRMLTLTAERVSAGLDSQVDLKQAQGDIPMRRAAISLLQEKRELLLNELAALSGLPPGSGPPMLRPRLHLPASLSLPSVVPADLVGRRPDVVSQRWRVEAAGHDIAVAKANFYPNINLVGTAGIQSLGVDQWSAGNRIFGIGPAISLPIFDAGRLRSGLAQQNAIYDGAVETYNATVLEALRDVSNQLASLQGLQDRLAQQQEALATADQSLKLARARYGAGLSNQVEMLIAEGGVLRQQRALADLQARSLSVTAALYRAIGGGELGADLGPAGPAPNADSSNPSSATTRLTDAH